MAKSTNTSSTPGPGHNSGAVNSEALTDAVARIERLTEEKAGIGEDIKSVFAVLKAQGFDTKIVREVLKRRKRDRDEMAEWDSLVAAYEDSLAGTILA